MKSVLVGMISGVLLFVAPVALLIIALLWLIQPRAQQARYVQTFALEHSNFSEFDIDDVPNVVPFPKQ